MFSSCRLDDSGYVVALYWNELVRNPNLRIPAEDVQAFYRAMKAFLAILEHPDNLYKRKMNSGKELFKTFFFSFEEECLFCLLLHFVYIFSNDYPTTEEASRVVFCSRKKSPDT